ncbi:unnamed protein product [Urochloa decumbens]|uniref:PLAC8 family protein n=1 Tax=Urochloa decumbens TaxID=240449 RepID=A0ABC8W335_9POAL
MANSSGGDAGDPRQKHDNGFHRLRQEHAAGMMFSYNDKRNEPPHSVGFNEQHMMENGSAYRQYYDDAASSDDWQSSSPPSTREMLGGHVDDDQQGNNNRRPPRPAGSSRRLVAPVAFVKKIDWGSLWANAKDWIRSPINMALAAWIAAVAVSGAILFMVMTGMLNRALPTKARRDTWFEVNNQILNALFTLMCLVQHPRRFYHLALLCRWRAADMARLRQAYCKGGTCKPGERKHMAVVVFLLHLNCFAQYALCGLNLGYRRPQRPVVGVALTISVAIGAPAVAGLYNNLSPLGNDYEAQPEADDEESSRNSDPQLQRKTILHEGGGGGMEWAGGVFDVWEDISLAYLSVFCSCCVMGWNAGRIGLGNMYVHVVTFLLLCLAPFFVFNLAAVNIDNEDARDALGLAGVFLCVLGLLYGGFWRIQMRRRLGLPPSHACCGKPDLADCTHWLCCYSCALAQEVRTVDSYQEQLSSAAQHRMDLHPTTLQQHLVFAGVLDSSLPPAARSGVTVPPAVSVIRTGT